MRAARLCWALDFDMKRFAIAFSIGILAFALANVVALFVRSDSYDDPDSKERYGFPLLTSEEYDSFPGVSPITTTPTHISVTKPFGLMWCLLVPSVF